PAEIDHVGEDNAAIGYMAAEHLLNQELRELAFVALRPTWDLSKLRAQGFMAAAAAADVVPTIYLEGDQTLATSFYGSNVVVADPPTLIQRLAASRTDRIGLFVPRDEETVYLYPLLREAGLEPGKDVVVVSCDNEAVRLSTL